MAKSNELLPIRIVGRAFKHVWDMRTDFLRMAALPIVALSILSTVMWIVYPPLAAPESFETMGQEQQLAVMVDLAFSPGRLLELIAVIIFYVMFAVAWHRVYLVPDEEITIARALSWNSNKTYFLFSLVIVVFLASMAGSLAGTLLLQVFQSVTGAAGFGLTFGAIMAICFYVFGRLSPVFPTTAIDQRIGLRGAWRLSSGSGWRLAMIALFPYIPLSFVVWITLGLVTSVLATLGLDTTATGKLIVELVHQAITYFGLAVGVSALSMAYVELEEESPE